MIVIELLKYIINRAALLGVISPPFMPHRQMDFPIIECVDDHESVPIIIILFKRDFSLIYKLDGTQSELQQILLTCHQLGCYQNSSVGCYLWLSNWFLPFTYLGLPVRCSKPRIQDFLPLMNKIERRWKIDTDKFYTLRYANIQHVHLEAFIFSY